MRADEERRRSRRLLLRLTVSYAFPSATGESVSGRGLTHNVCADGVYFEWRHEAPPPIGTAGDVWLAIPDSALALTGGVEVLRADRLHSPGEDHCWGVAVRFQQRPQVMLPLLDDLLPRYGNGEWFRGRDDPEGPRPETLSP
jgi:hypothetical protein